MRICATYLSFREFESGPCQTYDEFKLRLESNQLYDYAARNWGHHARHASILCPVVMGFLESKGELEASIQAMMLPVNLWFLADDNLQLVPKIMSGIHLAAWFGVKEAIKAILSKSVDVDAKDSAGRTPLVLAAKHGHDVVVKLLLDAGKADIESKDMDGRTPLLWAAWNGNTRIVKLLLDTGKVNVNSNTGLLGWTPLSKAAQNGHDAVVKLLLDTGKVNIESKNSTGYTPLLLAAQNGHDAVVKLLLDTGKADMEFKDVYGCTPLFLAAQHGHNAVVKLLLDTGKVDIETKDREYGYTPLSLATRNGHGAVVKLLLNAAAANIESNDNTVCTQSQRSYGML